MIIFIIFTLTVLFYHNYIILNEDEFIIIVGNLIWLVLGNTLVVSYINKVLCERGEIIKKIFYWYLNKKKSLYIKLILNYSYLYSNCKIMVSNRFIYNKTLILLLLYAIIESKKVYYRNFVNNLVLLKFLSLKMYVNNFFLRRDLEHYLNKEDIQGIFLKKLSNK